MKNNNIVLNIVLTVAILGAIALGVIAVVQNDKIVSNTNTIATKQEVTLEKEEESDKTCAAVITKAHEDDKYTYYAPTPCYMEDTYVKFKDGARMNLQEALDKKLLTIDEMIEAGAKITKEKKPDKNSWSVQTIPSSSICTQNIVKIYEDDKYEYTVANECYINETFIVFEDGRKYNLREAIEQEIVSIYDLVGKNVKITKSSKRKPDVTIQPVLPVDPTPVNPPANSNPPTNSWTVQYIPSGMMCTQALEKIYDDGDYYYAVPNGCYAYEYYVVFNDGTKYNIKDAVQKGIVTVNELINAGVSISRYEKQNVTIPENNWTIESKADQYMCAQVITTLYEDNSYVYTVPNPCYIDYTQIVYTNGARYNIKDALENGIVTIDEVILKAKFNIYKDRK